MRSALWPWLPRQQTQLTTRPVTLQAEGVWKKRFSLESIHTSSANLLFPSLKLFLNHSQFSLSAVYFSSRDRGLSLILMVDTKPPMHRAVACPIRSVVHLPSHYRCLTNFSSFFHHFLLHWCFLLLWLQITKQVIHREINDKIQSFFPLSLTQNWLMGKKTFWLIIHSLNFFTYP